MRRYGAIGVGLLTLGLILLSVYLGVGRSQEHRLRVSVEALADRLAAELANLHGDLDEARAEARQSRQALDGALSERDALAQKLRDRDELLDRMKLEMSQLKLQFQKVNLGSVTVPPAAGSRQMQVEEMPAATGSGPSAQGAVVALNEEFHFAIVNLGSKNGIREGMTLAVIQDGVQAGNLRVDMVDEAVSAAALLSNVDRKIKVGDIIHTT